MRAPFHALLHDQATRHRARPGDRAVRRERPWRKNFRGERARQGRHLPHCTSGSELIPMAHLLIVDDDQNTLASLARAFRLSGHEATVCDNANRAIELARAGTFDMILSDVVMPGKDGLTLLEELRGLNISLPVVMISGQATVDMAVRATRLGAIDFLEKPLSTDKLLITVENGLRLTRLERENRELRQRVGGQHDIVWSSEPMRKLM